MTTPLAGLHHTALTVKDISSSATWYHEVLGLAEVFRDPDGGRAVLRLPDGRMVGLVQHENGRGDFDPHHVGLDHVAFSVGSREEMEEWVCTFAEAGVTHSDIVDTPFGAMLNFKDPDNIALLLSWDRGFPAEA